MTTRILTALLLPLLLFGAGCSRQQKDIPPEKEKGGQPFAEVKAAAEKGNAQSQLKLGLMYRYGDGTSRNVDEALKWLRKAAEQGNIDAMCELYRVGLYPNAPDYTFSSDGRQLLSGTNKHAQNPLTVDPGEAISWLKKAAETGDVNSQFFLGAAFRNGHGGMTKDANQAKAWWEKAAGRGHLEAEVSLALVLLPTDSSISNPTEGLKWLRKAADKGHPDAQVALGEEYEFGVVVPKDAAKAREWYGKAAAQGNEQAKKKLGQ